jgi:hypothetical protein
MDALIYRTSDWVERYLERPGLLVCDIDNSCLSLGSRDNTVMDEPTGNCVSYHDMTGPN